MGKKKLIIVLTLAAALLHLNVMANVTLARIFSNNMVVQRDKPFKVWGWASKGEKVTVSFYGQKVSTKADKDGNWLVQFKPVGLTDQKLDMTVVGKNSITLNNILVGDVYICSGQSNMEWIIRNTNNSAAEIQNSTHPGIRMFTVPHTTSFTPAKDFASGEWQESNPQNVGDFSAVAYFFARKLNQDLNIPIGLIHSSWGGTNVQAWISWDIMGKEGSYKTVDLSKMELEKVAIDKRRNDFAESLKNDIGMKEKWFEPNAGMDWKNIMLPKIWEETEIGNADGVIWFRKEFDVPASAVGKAVQLSLGPIDDDDITYVNGTQVGTTSSWNSERVYNVSPSLLKAGKNTIVIKVTDTGGGGGIYGKPEQLFINVGGLVIPLSGEWKYKPSALSTAFNISGTGPNDFASQLYNAMIAPVINYPIRGGIWYQGEANAKESYKYRTLFPTMIRDWRNKWKDEFPFYWVQLANFMAADSLPVESGWAELREAQSMTLALPKTGQAVIIDIGEANDIHPRNKQDVGYRLALAAEHLDYAKDIVYSGPVYKSMRSDADKIILTFESTGTGLWAKDKYGYLRGFAIAGADKKFKWAKATIVGNTVTVWADGVSKPVAVRYAWANNPADANLYNKEGLPASPFRTDDWQGITVGKSDYR